MMESQQNIMEIGDYVAILLRRKWSFILTFFLILSIGVTIAFILPPLYRSQATILIERPAIPQNFVATTVTGYVQERIEGIRQRIVTYDNIVALANDLNLFPELREKGDISTLVKEIRKNIVVEMVEIQAGGKRNTAAVAFTVAFEASDAGVAQKVTAEIANQYLEANKEIRNEQTLQVSQFLAQEADRLNTEISQLEQRLAVFKQEQSSQLPELFGVNTRLYEKTEEQLEKIQDRIIQTQDRIVLLESELSLTDPRKAVLSNDGSVVQTPGERLSFLASQYLQDSVRYAPSHPDIVRMQREIQALGSQSSEAAKVSELISQLTRLRSQLLKARERYENKHPDVLKLEKAVAAIENQLRNINLADSHDASFQHIPPDNPRYVALNTQLETARSNLKEEYRKQISSTEKLHEYERRLFQTPIVERDYQVLTRDYANAKKKYTEIRNKQLEARLAEQLEGGEKGERFVLEGKAFYPTKPDKPNRLGIVLLTILLAGIGGIFALAIAEFRDDRLRGQKDVGVLFGALPVAVIPYIENAADLSRKKKRKIIWLGLVLIVMVSAAGFWYLSNAG